MKKPAEILWDNLNILLNNDVAPLNMKGDNILCMSLGERPLLFIVTLEELSSPDGFTVNGPTLSSVIEHATDYQTLVRGGHTEEAQELFNRFVFERIVEICEEQDVDIKALIQGDDDDE